MLTVLRVIGIALLTSTVLSACHDAPESKRIQLIKQLTGDHCDYLLDESSVSFGDSCQPAVCSNSIETKPSSDFALSLGIRMRKCISDAYVCLGQPHLLNSEVCDFVPEYTEEEWKKLIALIRNENEVEVRGVSGNSRQMIPSGKRINTKVALLSLLEPFVDKEEVEILLRELLENESSVKIKKAVLFILSLKKQESFSRELINVVKQYAESPELEIRTLALLSLVAINNEESIAIVKKLLGNDTYDNSMSFALLQAFLDRRPKDFFVEDYPDVYWHSRRMGIVGMKPPGLENYKNDILEMSNSDRLLESKTQLLYRLGVVKSMIIE